MNMKTIIAKSARKQAGLCHRVMPDNFAFTQWRRLSESYFEAAGLPRNALNSQDPSVRKLGSIFVREFEAEITRLSEEDIYSAFDRYVGERGGILI